MQAINIQYNSILLRVSWLIYVRAPMGIGQAIVYHAFSVHESNVLTADVHTKPSVGKIKPTDRMT